MITSRGLSLLKASCRYASAKKAATNLQLSRLSHGFTYREIAKQHWGYYAAAEVLGGIAWWWVLWHLYHEMGHITGEYEYPDVTKWTDEELGIPPEDE